MPVRPLLLLSLAITLTGCATMAHGTTQAIPIISTPSGARVTVDSVPIGVTPLLATVSRTSSHIVSIAHDSLPPVRVVMNRSLSPWILGSLFLDGIPAIVDFSNGAAYKFSVDTLHVVLTDATTVNRMALTELSPTTSIQTSSLGMATAAAYFIGFGLGHKLIGGRALPFFISDFASASVMMIGIGVAGHDEDTGSLIALAGFTALGISRIWEVVDFVGLTSNRPALSASTQTSRGAELSLVPVFDARKKGIALRYTF
jgi:hypothetical protein